MSQTVPTIVRHPVGAIELFLREHRLIEELSIGLESRSLEVRCGIKKQGETRKHYVHMLNGTLCATERALCCVVENYQTPEVSSSGHGQTISSV